MKKNQHAREDLEILYGAKCMLTDYQDRLNFHHLKKKCDGGPATIENGALLNRDAHDYLHKQEGKQLYEELNECLELYKLCYELNESECLNEWENVKEQFVKRMKRGVV